MRERQLTPRLAVVFAVICGLTTANAYYAQPLLDLIADGLRASSAETSLIVTLGQIGNGVGLLFVVPAADIVPRRTLLTGLYAANTLALAGSAAAPGIGVLAALALVIGLCAVAIPIITAYVASLADDTTRGRALGVVMGGVLFGILLSRTVASLIASVGGWRAVYVVAAVLMAGATLAVRNLTVGAPVPVRSSYAAQLASVLTQFRTHPILRSRCLIGACVMAAFTGFWTSVAFLLSRPPFEFSEAEIGVFALSGVAGALIVSLGGRFNDRYRHRRWQSTGVGLLVLLPSFGLLGLGGSSIVWLVVGAVVMDAAIQAVHVTNQSVVYELDERARARLASGYMTSFAVGGAVGSALSAQAFDRWGWYGSCWVCVAFSALGLLVWATASGSERARQRTLQPAQQQPATA